MNPKLLLKIILAPTVVLLLHIAGTVSGLYETNWWMDIPAHFLGGVAIVISTIYVLNHFRDKNQFSVTWKPLYILILIAFASMSAVAWELMEFLLDTYLHTGTQLSLLDTVKDMCMGISGGGLTAIIHSLKKSR